ncbi:MAG TPA: DUF3619 family protein [Burkholderiales bacterium]|jgi:hypothetical protein|nr:DUF3619 family protein [Burkholderiales bacterium]
MRDVQTDTMNELQFTRRIRHYLDQSTQLDAAVAEKLQAARQLALSRQRPEPAPVLAWADNTFGNGWGWAGLSARVLLPAAVLIVAVAGIYNWQEKQRLAEIVEIDSQLLTDDLPIDAYLDRGFENWLKKRAAEQ